MNKIVPILSGLFPYLYLVCIATMSFWDLDGAKGDLILFAFFGLYILLSIVAAVLYAVFATPQTNLWVKLAAIPTDLAAIAFIAIRIIEDNQAAADGAMGVGLGVFAMILFALPYISTRIHMAIACAVACGRDPKVPSYHTLLHLLPIADLISAALLRKNQQHS